LGGPVLALPGLDGRLVMRRRVSVRLVTSGDPETGSPMDRLAAARVVQDELPKLPLEDVKLMPRHVW
jgi:hypothetical protein